MATKSVAHQIIDAIIARLQTIRVADGFNTDAGRQVYWARRHVDANSIVVWRVDETPDDSTQSRMAQLLTLTVEGHVEAEQAETGQQLEYLLADIKKAVLVEGGVGGRGIQASGGESLTNDVLLLSTTAAEREDGQTTEAVLVNLEIHFPEKYGDPYAVL